MFSDGFNIYIWYARKHACRSTQSNKRKTISPFHVSTKIIPVRYKQFYLQASMTRCYHSLIKIPVQEHTRLYSHTYIHVVIIFDILLKQHTLYLWNNWLILLKYKKSSTCISSKKSTDLNKHFHQGYIYPKIIITDRKSLLRSSN